MFPVISSEKLANIFLDLQERMRNPCYAHKLPSSIIKELEALKLEDDLKADTFLKNHCILLYYALTKTYASFLDHLSNMDFPYKLLSFRFYLHAEKKQLFSLPKLTENNIIGVLKFSANLDEHDLEDKFKALEFHATKAYEDYKSGQFKVQIKTMTRKN